MDLHFTFQSTRLFSNETTEIPALAPCKMEVTLMIYVDCKSKYVRMVTTFQSQSKTERCLKVDQCSWVQLHKPHEIQQPMPNFQVHPTSEEKTPKPFFQGRSDLAQKKIEDVSKFIGNQFRVHSY